MQIPRSLTVQSVLYATKPEDVERSAEALANSVRAAREAGLVSNWTLALGDCSPMAVLDDGNVGRIRGAVEEFGGSLVYRHFGANVGHGGGHNAIAPVTQSELLLFLNPDALVGPDTVSVLVAALVKGVGAVDGRQLPLEHAKDYDPKTGDTSWASGACLATTRAVFDAVHGFDHDTFFMYCDDVDYSWRVALSGARVVHEPAARVFHDKRLTTTGDIIAGDAEIYYSAEAALMLAHKYSRPEIVGSILASFKSQNEDAVTRAAAEFEKRQQEGTLPVPLDPDHAVGQFVEGQYAIHRY